MKHLYVGLIFLVSLFLFGLDKPQSLQYGQLLATMDLYTRCNNGKTYPLEYAPTGSPWTPSVQIVHAPSMTSKDALEKGLFWVNIGAAGYVYQIMVRGENHTFLTKHVSAYYKSGQVFYVERSLLPDDLFGMTDEYYYDQVVYKTFPYQLPTQQIEGKEYALICSSSIRPFFISHDPVPWEQPKMVNFFQLSRSALAAQGVVLPDVWQPKVIGCNTGGTYAYEEGVCPYVDIDGVKVFPELLSLEVMMLPETYWHRTLMDRDTFWSVPSLEAYRWRPISCESFGCKYSPPNTLQGFYSSELIKLNGVEYYNISAQQFLFLMP